MKTSFGYQQLLLFGLSSPATAAKIGGDERSLFQRPIIAVAESPAENAPRTSDSQSVETDFDKWLSRVGEYRSAASGPASREVSDGTEPTETAPAGASPAGDGSATDAETEAAEVEPSASAADGDGTSTDATSTEETGASSGGTTSGSAPAGGSSSGTPPESGRVGLLGGLLG